MQDKFGESLAFTLQFEGGWSDTPRDPGGCTNHGITLATFSHELGCRASVAALRNISPSMVSSIYRKKFWNVVGADGLPAGVDLMLFDIAVNNGPGRALEWERATGNMHPKDRITRLDQLRLGFWKRLATWAYFGRGWTRREVACKALALKMAGV